MTFNADDGPNRNEIYDVNTLTIGLVWKGRGGVENKSQTSAGGIARQKHNAVRETTTRLHEYLHCSIFTPSPHCECDRGLYYGKHAGNLQPPYLKHA